MGFLDHAKREMHAAGYYDKGADYDGMIPAAVEEVVAVFAKWGHSGGSAAIVLGILEKVLRYEPLCPLRGTPDEWEDVSGIGDGSIPYQNKRCSHVFAMGINGEGAYDIEGRIFKDRRGTFTNHNSKVPVIFPYSPTREYVTIEDGQSILEEKK